MGYFSRIGNLWQFRMKMGMRRHSKTKRAEGLISAEEIASFAYCPES
jgi:hypothetical protein